MSIPADKFSDISPEQINQAFSEVLDSFKTDHNGRSHKYIHYNAEQNQISVSENKTRAIPFAQVTLLFKEGMRRQAIDSSDKRIMMHSYFKLTKMYQSKLNSPVRKILNAIANFFHFKTQAQETFSKALESLSSITTTEHYTDLLPARYELKEEWSRRIITSFKLEKNTDTSGITIKLENMPASKFEYYCHLQEEIAKLIPEECFRPTIDLQLRGDKVNEQQSTFGILGGVGPLSDAEILKRVMEGMDPEAREKVKIDLLSKPPPRTTQQKVSRGLGYSLGVRSFGSRPGINKICVTSNTAHANLSALNTLCQNKMISLADKVVDKIKEDEAQGPTRTLVLGTKEAYDKKLYPHLLENKQLQVKVVSPEDSLRLQDMINTTKGGQPRVVAMAFLDFINNEIQNAEIQDTPITHILLGCTELPMILANLPVERRHEFLELQKKITFVDTEEIFADSIRKEIST